MYMMIMMKYAHICIIQCARNQEFKKTGNWYSHISLLKSVTEHKDITVVIMESSSTN
jgi:hypothetical protein